MKRYKLLKDLPFAKAGEELYFKHDEETGYFTLYKDVNKMSAGDLHEGFIENFDEWFETQELKKYYYIGSMGHIENTEYQGWEFSAKLRKSIGNYFETREEAEKYLEFLKAKTIIKQDTKGFKPDWNDKDETKYWGYWDFYKNKLDYDWDYGAKRVGILFKTIKDIEESFKKHPEEWKTYLSYEQ